MPDQDYPNKLGFQQATNSLLNKIDFANLNFKPIKPFDATVLYIPTLYENEQIIDKNEQIIDNNVSKINYNIFKNVYMIKNIPAINERPRIFNIGTINPEMYTEVNGLYEVKVPNPEENTGMELVTVLEDGLGPRPSLILPPGLKRTYTDNLSIDSSQGSSINTWPLSRSPSLSRSSERDSDSERDSELPRDRERDSDSERDSERDSELPRDRERDSELPRDRERPRERSRSPPRLPSPSRLPPPSPPP
jgi:hypothetical protein